MVKLMHEYKEVLSKLAGVTALTASSRFAELPWLATDGSSLISVTGSEQVDHQHTAARRKRLIDMVIAPQLSPERQKLQLELMVSVLTKMAAGMATALARLMSPKYGTIFSLAADSPELGALSKIPATSDYIERYFGLASWLASMDNNKTKVNLNHTLNITETSGGSRMVEAYLKDPEAVGAMVENVRVFRDDNEKILKARKSKVTTDKDEAYRNAEKDRIKKNEEKAENVANMLTEALTWRHLPMVASRRSGRGETTIASEVTRVGVEAGGTDRQQGLAVVEWAYRWLCVFKTVFDLDEIPELRAVFFGDSGKPGIKTGRSVKQLVANVGACSLYMDGKSAQYRALLDRLVQERDRTSTAPRAPSSALAGRAAA